MHSLRIKCSRIVVVALVAVGLYVGPSPGEAAASSRHAGAVVSAQGAEESTPFSQSQIRQAIIELEAAGIAYTQEHDIRTYRIPGAGSLSLPVERDTRLGGGISSNGSGVYLDLNATDQQALINGTGAGIGAALCLVGPAVCVISAALIAIGATYVNSNGLCPGNLRIEADWNGALQRTYCV